MIEVRYGDRRVEKLATDLKYAKRQLGDQYAKGLAKRLTQLEAADSLSDVFPPSVGKWHWLKGERSGLASATVKDGVRIVVRPDNGVLQPPTDATQVTIVEIDDYHE